MLLTMEIDRLKKLRNSNLLHRYDLEEQIKNLKEIVSKKDEVIKILIDILLIKEIFAKEKKYD